VLGNHVPEMITERLYDLFSSKRAEQLLQDATMAAASPAQQHQMQQNYVDKLKTNQFGQLDEQ